MADQNPSREQSELTATSTLPMATWVKASLVIAALVIVVVVVNLLSGGEHGPGRHLGNADGTAPLLAEILRP